MNTVSRRGVPPDGMFLVRGFRELSTPFFLLSRVRLLLPDCLSPPLHPPLNEIPAPSPPPALGPESDFCCFFSRAGDLAALSGRLFVAVFGGRASGWVARGPSLVLCSLCSIRCVHILPSEGLFTNFVFNLLCSTLPFLRRTCVLTCSGAMYKEGSQGADRGDVEAMVDRVEGKLGEVVM